MKTIIKISLVMLLVVISSLPIQADDHGNKAQKAVLITGASTGIGRLTAETLAKDGYFVYAGARKQKDMDALNKVDNIKAVKLDVTKQDQVDAAVAMIMKEGRGLYGLVNNAGVVASGPLIEQDESDMRWLFDVNVFGVVKVTKAFAPLIIESKGRIVNIGSISGIGTWVMGGDYTMSKHAIEAFSDTLGLEMERFGVKVSVVQPGNYNSKIATTAVKRHGELTEAQKISPYAEDYERMFGGDGDRSRYKEPHEVASAISHALFDPEPRVRYMVVPNKGEANWTIGASMRRLVQRNENQEHAFSRDELIKMLDDAIAAERKAN